MPWYIASDQILSVDGLKDPVTDAYVNDANVQATMYHADGVTPVLGQTWPLQLDYVIASEGDYTGILEDGRELEDGRTYWIEVVANAGGDFVKTWRQSDVARHRTFAEA